MRLKINENYDINTLREVVEDLIVQSQKVYNPKIADILQSNGIKVRNERGYLIYYLDSADLESLRSAGIDLMDYIISNKGYVGPETEYMLGGVFEGLKKIKPRKSGKKLVNESFLTEDLITDFEDLGVKFVNSTDSPYGTSYAKLRTDKDLKDIDVEGISKVLSKYKYTYAYLPVKVGSCDVVLEIYRS